MACDGGSYVGAGVQIRSKRRELARTGIYFVVFKIDTLSGAGKMDVVLRKA